MESKIEPKKFFNDLKEKYEDFDYIFQAVQLKDKLETTYKSITEWETPDPIEECPQDTLRKYCDENAIDPDMTSLDCLNAIDKVHHGDALRSAWKLFKDKRNKVHVLWLCGKASVGKSYFIRRLR